MSKLILTEDMKHQLTEVTSDTIFDKIENILVNTTPDEKYDTLYSFLKDANFKVSQYDEHVPVITAVSYKNNNKYVFPIIDNYGIRVDKTAVEAGFMCTHVNSKKVFYSIAFYVEPMVDDEYHDFLSYCNKIMKAASQYQLDYPGINCTIHSGYMGWCMDIEVLISRNKRELGILYNRIIKPMFSKTNNKIVDVSASVTISNGTN